MIQIDAQPPIIHHADKKDLRNWGFSQPEPARVNRRTESIASKPVEVRHPGDINIPDQRLNTKALKPENRTKFDLTESRVYHV